MRDVYDTIEYRGHTIEIGFEQDDSGHFDPRDWSNVGTMHCAHRNYNLGDEQTDAESMTVECPVQCEGDYLPVPTTAERDPSGYRYRDPGFMACPFCEGNGERVDPVQWALAQGATVVLGLYLYEHSGITMRASTLYRGSERIGGGNPFTCRWDSGMVGIMFDTPDAVREGWQQYDSESKSYTGTWLTDDGQHPSAERIEERLHAEVKVYDSYLTNDIMWWRTEGPTDDDSCGGYFPDENGRHDSMVEEAKGSIDASIRIAWERGIEEVLEQQKIARIMAL